CTVPEVPADQLGVVPEHRQAAAGQYARVTELLREGGGDVSYALQLLLSCCKLDPANFLYRKMLREVARDKGGKRGGWFGSLSHLPARRRLAQTAKAGEHKKVLEDGEDLLVKLPGDVPTQLTMAEAALARRAAGLAVWLLEEARAGAPDNLPILHALVEAHVAQKRYKQAITVLESIQKLAPDDDETRAKIRALAVHDTLNRGNYRL